MALDFMNRLNKSKTVISEASSGKKIIAAVLLVLGVGVLSMALMTNNQTRYDVLYSQLAPEDAGAIIEELKKRQISYRLSESGTVIELPSDKTQETRLALAVMGLPSKGNVGLEIFDHQKLGTTDFAQKVNLQRAITGELERTIMQFPEVEQARVHLSVPTETLFIEEQNPPSASVTLTLRPGTDLDKPKLLGIVHLMTSAVESLKPDNISIIDTNGGLLWSRDSTRPGAMDEDQLKQRRSFEKNMGDRVNSLVEKVVGPNKASTRVSAELDLREVVTNEDIYDPERTAVRSEQRIQDRTEGAARGAVGAPNATYELGTGNRGFAGGGDGKDISTHSEETTNYEITNIKRQTIAASGDLRKLTVAVMVDGTWATNAAGEKEFVPMAQKQLDQLTELVKNTVGFDESRGDRVSVNSIPFYRAEDAPFWAGFLLEVLREFYRPFINILLICCFFFFVVRPIVNWLRKEVEPSALAPEPAVLPELPHGPRPGANGLPMPETAVPSLAESQDLAPAFDDHQEADYDGQEQPDDDDEPRKLAKGHLSRENILPIARDNLEKTVGQVRSWIEEKPSGGDDQHYRN